MKLVTAIINPFKLGSVREALSNLGGQGMTVTDLRGFGRQKGHAPFFGGAEYPADLLPKVKIEVAADDGSVEQVVDAIRHAAQTGKPGDGRLFINEVGAAVRIRTGEANAEAI
jgi:nitrogen regulatory protein P-II 2